MLTKKQFTARFPFDPIEEVTVLYDEKDKPLMFSWGEEEDEFMFFDKFPDGAFILSVLSDTEKECEEKIQKLTPSDETINSVLSMLDRMIRTYGTEGEPVKAFLKTHEKACQHICKHWFKDIPSSQCVLDKPTSDLY